MESVSVIIPTWNRAHCIGEAIQSALSQDFISEVIICDDGSTDHTEEIVLTIKKNDERVTWLPGPHTGLPAAARNRGIKESKGDWIAFLDSDDTWLPDKIKTQLEYIKETDCKAISSNANRCLKNNSEAKQSYLNYSNPIISFENLININWVICSSMMVHKSIFETVKGFPEKSNLKVGEDYALWLRVATVTDIAYLNDPLIDYLDNPSECIRNYSTNQREEKRVVLDNFSRWLQETNELKFKKEYIEKLIAQEIKKNANRFSFAGRLKNMLSSFR